jgi:integrase
MLRGLAISAFQKISGINPISSATPGVCATFQREALTRQRFWRSTHPKRNEDTKSISPSTVVKWSSALAAAFERINRNAGRKCVRGVVDDCKLLSENPWKQFTWVEGTKRPIRQFTADELISLLDFLTNRWTLVTTATAAAKVLLWSGCRREEIITLTWPQLRSLQGEYHFDIEGKHGVRRWFRLPNVLFHDLEAVRVEGNPYIFAAYSAQLRSAHMASQRPCRAQMVKEKFRPTAFGDWLHDQVAEWSRTLPGGHAYLHVFRKTALQFARTGEDANRRVAEDARVGEKVMLGHYVTEQDEQLRASSNRTFQRLAAALPPEVALRFGHDVPQPDPLEVSLQAAVDARNWELVRQLSTQLEKRKQSAG